MWQSKRAQWAKKTLVRHSESADDSVHVATFRNINLTPRPRQACSSREVQSRAHAFMVMGPSALILSPLILQ